MKCKRVIRIASLFSGIGGFEEGIKRTQIPYEIVFSSEIDKYAKKSYMANFNVSNLNDDIKLISENDIPEHDILVAGFPCQSFSIAGQKKGFNDSRGTLFFDVIRILKKKKPKYIILENVKNLLSHDKNKTIKFILGQLSDIGYAIDFTLINSSEAGIPQNRDRVYIVGIYNGKSEKFNKDIRSNLVNKLKKEFNDYKLKSFNFFERLKFDNELMVIEDILEKNVESSFYIKSSKLNIFLKNNNYDEKIEKSSRIEKLFDLPKEIHNDLERQRRVYSIKGISPTILARSDSPKIFIKDENRVRKLTPEESFYIQRI